MVAKLAMALLVIAFVLAVAVVVAYRYFDRQAERHHEKDLKQMEHTEQMMDIAENETGIDAELEREKDR